MSLRYPLLLCPAARSVGHGGGYDPADLTTVQCRAHAVPAARPWQTRLTLKMQMQAVKTYAQTEPMQQAVWDSAREHVYVTQQAQTLGPRQPDLSVIDKDKVVVAVCCFSD